MSAVRLPDPGVRAALTLLRRLGWDLRRWDGHPPPLLQRTLFRRIYFPRSHLATARLNGVELLFPTCFFPTLALRGFDRLTTARLRQHLKPGAVVVDVGAHVGYYTLLSWPQVAPTGAVHAVEPAPANLAVLRANLQRWPQARVTVHPCAAGAANGVGELLITPFGDTNSFFAHPLAAAVERRQVPIVPLDQLVPPPVDLVKIDVEGAELEVLAGMKGLLAASPGAALVVEWNPACLRAAGHPPEELPATLVELGFAVTVLDEEGGQPQDLSTFLATHSVPSLPPAWFANLWAERG